MCLRTDIVMVTVILSYSHSQSHDQGHGHFVGHGQGLGDGHCHEYDMLFTIFMMVSYVRIPYFDERMYTIFR